MSVLLFFSSYIHTGRALAYKEDGNELFKKKKYKDAIAAYTDGLKQGSTDPQIMAVLYCNRAASHYFIGQINLIKAFEFMWLSLPNIINYL